MPARSAVLSGLSLATGIAREATDGVPIVKQVLGVASRIVELAEKVDKNREDLHALADRAKNMDATITDIIRDRELDSQSPAASSGGREPVRIGARMLGDGHLTRTVSVLRAVEKHFEKHIQQGRVRKTFGYIFTVRKEVDRLRGEFDDRLRELEVAASLDTNISAKRDARFNGEFRNIRHCEIELLRRITPQYKPCQGFQIKCHLATCDGSNQVVVVREIVGSDQDKDARRRIEAHDKFLELLSLVRNRHPNIAYLYGRNAGPADNRFAVLKAGNVRLLDDVVNGKAEISFIGRIVAKLVDVACHLRKYGATWAGFPASRPILYLDDKFEPKIGIQDDLYALTSTPAFHAMIIQVSMAGILGTYCRPVRSPENDCPPPHSKCTKWVKEIFGVLIEARYHTVLQKATVFQRVDIPSLIPLSQESRTYLQHFDGCISPRHTWDMILFDLAIGESKCEGSCLYAVYERLRPSCQHEHIVVHYINNTIDTMYYSVTRFEIPSSAANEVRERLGIPASNDDEESDDNRLEEFHLMRFAAPNATSMECSGWCPGNPYKNSR